MLRMCRAYECFECAAGIGVWWVEWYSAGTSGQKYTGHNCIGHNYVGHKRVFGLRTFSSCNTEYSAPRGQKSVTRQTKRFSMHAPKPSTVDALCSVLNGVAPEQHRHQGGRPARVGLSSEMEIPVRAARLCLAGYHKTLFGGVYTRLCLAGYTQA